MGATRGIPMGALCSASDEPKPKTAPILAAASNYLQVDPNDRYDLRNRFCAAHAVHFASALKEIRSGRKRGCWSWYIFPTAPFVVNGHECGSMKNRKYALRDQPEGLVGDACALEYLNFKADGVSIHCGVTVPLITRCRSIYELIMCSAL